MLYEGFTGQRPSLSERIFRVENPHFPPSDFSLLQLSNHYKGRHSDFFQ